MKPHLLDPFGIEAGLFHLKPPSQIRKLGKKTKNIFFCFPGSQTNNWKIFSSFSWSGTICGTVWAIGLFTQSWWNRCFWELDFEIQTTRFCWCELPKVALRRSGLSSSWGAQRQLTSPRKWRGRRFGTLEATAACGVSPWKGTFLGSTVYVNFQGSLQRPWWMLEVFEEIH